MSGYSSATQSDRINALPIIIEGKQYGIDYHRFTRQETANDDQLDALNEDILTEFKQIEKQINKKTGSLYLDPNFCKKALENLASLGWLAYKRLFFDVKDAHQKLAMRLKASTAPVPTFISDTIPFPWELLYEGEQFDEGDANKFWGIRYPVARILEPSRDLYDYAFDLYPPLDMLFCLYHRLQHAHKEEWPAISEIIKTSPNSQVRILGATYGYQCGSEKEKEGRRFIRHLDTNDHNMIHFACHCQPSDKAGVDNLRISIIEDPGNVDEKSNEIVLTTRDLEAVTGRFAKAPLVFLNACQSSGGTDRLHKTYNLTTMFAKHGAGAIIATACPVPDLFAAAFARVFYEYFLLGKKSSDKPDAARIKMTIGQALQATRLHFITEHHNPLGLAYGLYSPSHYQLYREPTKQGAHTWQQPKN